MAMATILKKLACMVVLCMVFTTMTNGVMTCNGVTKTLAPCISYLRGTGGPAPPRICCGGVRALKGMARTPADRRSACKCMKSAAGRIKGLNYRIATKLPNQCGVAISYSLSPNTNCNNVQ